MTTTETRPSLQIREEHGSIKAQLVDIEKEERLGALLERLGALRGSLERHFAFEESEEGMRGVVRDSAPERMDELEGLFAEHDALGRDLDALEATTRDLLSTRDALIARIRAHEARESELLTAALYEDLGGLD